MTEEQEQVYLAAWVPRELRDEIRRYAIETDRTLSQVVRQALREYAARERGYTLALV